MRLGGAWPDLSLRMDAHLQDGTVSRHDRLCACPLTKHCRRTEKVQSVSARPSGENVGDGLPGSLQITRASERAQCKHCQGCVPFQTQHRTGTAQCTPFGADRSSQSRRATRRSRRQPSPRC